MAKKKSFLRRILGYFSGSKEVLHEEMQSKTPPDHPPNQAADEPPNASSEAASENDNPNWLSKEVISEENERGMRESQQKLEELEKAQKKRRESKGNWLKRLAKNNPSTVALVLLLFSFAMLAALLYLAYRNIPFVQRTVDFLAANDLHYATMFAAILAAVGVISQLPSLRERKLTTMRNEKLIAVRNWLLSCFVLMTAAQGWTLYVHQKCLEKARTMAVPAVVHLDQKERESLIQSRDNILLETVEAKDAEYAGLQREFESYKKTAAIEKNREVLRLRDSTKSVAQFLNGRYDSLGKREETLKRDTATANANIRALQAMLEKEATVVSRTKVTWTVIIAVVLTLTLLVFAWRSKKFAMLFLGLAIVPAMLGIFVLSTLLLSGKICVRGEGTKEGDRLLNQCQRDLGECNRKYDSLKAAFAALPSVVPPSIDSTSEDSIVAVTTDPEPVDTTRQLPPPSSGKSTKAGEGSKKNQRSGPRAKTIEELTKKKHAGSRQYEGRRAARLEEFIYPPAQSDRKRRRVQH